MRIRISIDRNAALKAGQDRYGLAVVDVPAADLTPRERELLAKWPRDTYGSLDETKEPVADVYMDGTIFTGVSEWRVCSDCPVDAATPEAIRKLLAHAEAKLKQAEADRIERQRQEKVAHERKVAQILAKPAENLICQRSVQGDLSWVAVDMPGDPRLDAQRNAAESLAEQRNQEAAAAKAAEEAKKAAVEAEKSEWIKAHGSRRLQRMLAEGIELEATYRDERLAADRPGWRWSKTVDGDRDDPRNPPEDAFAILDEARKTAPDAKLAYWTVERVADYGEDEEDEDKPSSKFAWDGYVAIAEFLGREIVFGGPQAE